MSGAGEIVVGQLARILVVVIRSLGVIEVAVIVGTGTGSTELEGLSVTLVEGFSGPPVFVVSVNRGKVDGRINGTGTRTGPATTYLIYSLDLLILQLGFFCQQ